MTFSMNLRQRLASRRTALRTLALFAMVTGSASVAYGQSRFDEDFDDKDKPWQEVAVQLPPFPTAENLLPFYVSPSTTHSFTIDAKSLAVGSDGVVRYTLVSSSVGGAKNVSFEGIRCQSLEKKLYAFGHPDGTWSRAHRDQWEPINGNQVNRQHAALAQDYLCQGQIVAGKASEILARIRNRRALSQ